MLDLPTPWAGGEKIKSFTPYPAPDPPSLPSSRHLLPLQLGNYGGCPRGAASCLAWFAGCWSREGRGCPSVSGGLAGFHLKHWDELSFVQSSSRGLGWSVLIKWIKQRQLLEMCVCAYIYVYIIKEKNPQLIECQSKYLRRCPPAFFLPCSSFGPVRFLWKKE